MSIVFQEYEVFRGMQLKLPANFLKTGRGKRNPYCVLENILKQKRHYPKIYFRACIKPKIFNLHCICCDSWNLHYLTFDYTENLTQTIQTVSNVYLTKSDKRFQFIFRLTLIVFNIASHIFLAAGTLQAITVTNGLR